MALLLVVVFIMSFSVGAFAGYENDYVRVEYPENYDVTEYSSSEDDTIGFFLHLYFCEWKEIDGKEFYTDNTVELIIENIKLIFNDLPTLLLYSALIAKQKPNIRTESIINA